MNKGVLRVLLIGLCAFFLAACVGFARTPKPAGAVTESAAECVVEVTSRRFLAEKRADDCLPMASTTKVMTAILAIEGCDLKEVVTIPREAQGVEGSSVYLKAGERYTVEDLLYGLMLRSGNDCAVALALHLSGSVEAFARKMNLKAALLGATDTHFVNPHGLPAKGHYTTARDLALIAAYAMEDPTFQKIVSTKYYATHNWQNKNKMLWNFEGATGVKTGFTALAGRCLVTSAERDGMKLVSVVLNSPKMYERTSELLETAYRDYRMRPLFRAEEPVGGLVGRRDFSYPLRAEEEKEIAVAVEKREPLPAQSGDFAGVVRITLKNNLIFSQNLYIM